MWCIVLIKFCSLWFLICVESIPHWILRRIILFPLMDGLWGIIYNLIFLPCDIHGGMSGHVTWHSFCTVSYFMCFVSLLCLFWALRVLWAFSDVYGMPLDPIAHENFYFLFYLALNYVAAHTRLCDVWRPLSVVLAASALLLGIMAFISAFISAVVAFDDLCIFHCVSAVRFCARPEFLVFWASCWPFAFSRNGRFSWYSFRFPHIKSVLLLCACSGRCVCHWLHSADSAVETSACDGSNYATNSPLNDLLLAKMAVSVPPVCSSVHMYV